MITHYLVTLFNVRYPLICYTTTFPDHTSKCCFLSMTSPQSSERRLAEQRAQLLMGVNPFFRDNKAAPEIGPQGR